MNEKSNYLETLINTYGYQDLSRKLGLNYNTLYKMQTLGTKPQTKTIRKICELTGKSMTETRKLMQSFPEKIPPLYPNIRKAVIKTALFFDQGNDIAFSNKDLTVYEKDLILFYYVIKENLKSIYNCKEYEVLTRDQRENTEAILKICEKETSLKKKLLDTFGMWFMKDKKYFFQNGPSNQKGIKFVNDIETLLKIKNPKG